MKAAGMGSRSLFRTAGRFALQLDTLLLLVAVFLTLSVNLPLWQKVWAVGRPGLFAALLCVVCALNFILLGLLSTRHTVRPLLTVLLPLSAVGAYYIGHYGIVIDPNMVRNVLSTDVREATELLGSGLFLKMLPAVLMLIFVWRVEIKQERWQRALGMRWARMGVALLISALAIFSVFQDFSSLMRNQGTLRYMMTPGNIVWSLGRVLVGDARAVTQARDPLEPVQRNAQPGKRGKPLLVVMVVGETARAANFSLNGYSRLTNPGLAQLDIINFAKTKACGTSTEVSLPCMFSPFGRADYDEDRIRRHESLLHLVQRAGIDVQWLDNQSGCKGVCAGLAFVSTREASVPGLCADGICFDEVLLATLKQTLSAQATGDRMVVLHQMGNHGPAYSRRYPKAFERFSPVCMNAALGKCSREEIVNAYDNAIAYTDYLLTQTIAYLKEQEAYYDVALLYVSDHGESLGEHGLFLHGMPYSIAPSEQTHVPMVWWMPSASAASRGIKVDCLKQAAAKDSSHDNLFHSLMGLWGVSAPSYKAERDLFAGCKK